MRNIVATGAGASLTIAPAAGSLVRIGDLRLSNGATVTFAPSFTGGGADAPRLLVVEGSTFSITGTTSTLDLTDNAMVVKNSTRAAIGALIAQAFDDNTWLGSGITSSSAAADPNEFTALGFVSNADLPTIEFAGYTDLDAGDVMVRYTYFGDANLDGETNVDDFPLYMAGLEDPSLPDTWAFGDFDYTGDINLDDWPLFEVGLSTGDTITVEPNGPASATAGTAYVLNLSDYEDFTPTGWTINWGDGTTEAIAGNPATVQHVYTSAPATRQVAVTAVDANDAYAAPSTIAVAVQKPAGPTNVVVTQNGALGLNVNWDAVAGTGVTYNVYVSTGRIKGSGSDKGRIKGSGVKSE